MKRELKWKPQFDRTVERFKAWWNCECVDRPPVWIRAQPSRAYQGPDKQHATAKDRWLDAQFNVERLIAEMQQYDWLGDSLPVLVPNVGPELTSALYGAEIGYLDAATGWSKPIIHNVDDWAKVLECEPDFDNPFWQTIERMTDLAIEAADDRYLVGMTDLHGNYDLLAGLREPQDLCMDLLDDAEAVLRAGRNVAKGFVKAFERNYRQVAKAGYGSTTWTRMYHEGPAYLPSCDFWCMVSTDVAREMILPDIITEMEPLERSLFHLDGPQALPHLDLLLELPQLTGVQWVYGDGNGPAARWIDVYKRILAAGKCVQVNAKNGDDALAVLDAIGPRGVWLLVHEPVATSADAEALIAEIARRSAAAIGH